mgnify:CR=1 FL=1
MEYVEIQLARILARIEKERLSLRGVIEDYIRHKIIDKTLIPIILTMGLGVLRNYILLDFISNQAVGINPKHLPRLKKWLLRIITYEIKFRWNTLSEDKINRIKRLLEELHLNRNYISAVRNYDYKRDLKYLNIPDKLSIQYSQPKWIVKYFMKLFDTYDCERLLRKFNEVPTVWIRVNTLKTTVKELNAKLKQRGIEAIPDNRIP